MPKDEFDFDDPLELNGMALLDRGPAARNQPQPCETRKTKGTTK